MKTVLFRADVSPQTGAGHLRRCLTLAEALKEQDKTCRIVFVCRTKDFDWHSLVSVADEKIDLDWEIGVGEDADRVVDLYRQQKADAAVVDHYRADEIYQQTLRDGGLRWLQFDGFMKQNFWADWILNANPNADEKRYKSLAKKPSAQFLLGASFALLRKEFVELQKAIVFRPDVRKILLTFGGGDDRGAIEFCLESLKDLDPAIERIVLVTKNNPRRDEISAWMNDYPATKVRLCVDAPDAAQIMAEVDLAVISGGTTVFETMALGIPTIIVAIAGNQEVNGALWEQTGACVYLGRGEDLDLEVLKHNVTSLIKDADKRRCMYDKAITIVDGLGARRVAEAMLGQKVLILK